VKDGQAPEASGDAGDGQSPTDAAADAAADQVDGGAPEADEAAEDDAGDAVAETGAEDPTILEVEGELLEERPVPDLSAELADARAESARYLDDLRRLKAEFENFRKRMMRDQSAVIASASSALVARLLPVLDNFDLAISAAEQSQDFEKMLKGVEMVYGELRDVLRGEGLTEIEAEGKPFDPQRHEAVVAVEADGVEPGTVVGVVRAGYELQGRVLRPAMVKVAQ
jgi:molecular chaperone GrpE